MRRLRNLFPRLVALAALFFVGCSTLQDFVLVNSGSESRTVVLEFRGKPEALMQMDSGSLEESSSAWNPLRGKALKTTGSGQELELTIAPGQGVRVLVALNYTGHDNDTLDLESVTLEDGTTIRGKELQHRFEKNSSGRYIFALDPIQDTKKTAP